MISLKILKLYHKHKERRTQGVIREEELRFIVMSESCFTFFEKRVLEAVLNAALAQK